MLRTLYHICFWVAFTGLFLNQTPDADVNDFASWFFVLGVSALAVYANLYLLLPKYFFRKNYLKYALLLQLTICVGAITLHFSDFSAKENFKAAFFQNFINIFFFVVITSSFKFFREYFRKQERIVKVENEQFKTELSLLKSQVNPHFLFNTLNNLYGLVLQNKNQQAADVIMKLSDLMRYLLDSSKTDKVVLNTEVQFIQDYLALERIRLAQQADIRFKISGMDKRILIAPLLFIPLVENAFKHGLQSLSDDCFAHFSLSVQGNEIYFEAKNSVGIQLDNHVKSEIGLANLRKRLKLIYPQKHLLEIVKNDKVFKVILNVSL